MKCASLRLQERTKKARAVTGDKPRRYCQRRMVDPGHEEDPRWTDVLRRFHCNIPEDNTVHEILYNNSNTCHNYDDIMCLTVQNLKFQGTERQLKPPRSSFKYKTLTNGTSHRMFVKQVIQDAEIFDKDRSSQLSSYYYDDFAKYIQNDRSRPSSGRSSLLIADKSYKTNYKENKATQVDIKKSTKIPAKVKLSYNTKNRNTGNTECIHYEKVTEEPKIAFHKSGKRRSLTISRAQSPETVQVIRVEVICNYSNSSVITEYEEKKPSKLDAADTDVDLAYANMKNTHFANRYLLTNTIKTLDERVSGGDNVTLLCKTYKLSDRGVPLKNNKNFQKNLKST